MGQAQGAIYSPPSGICTIEITNIDTTTRTIRLQLIVEDPTAPPIFPDRSTTQVVYQYADLTYSAIIGKDDFDWQLVGTNKGNASHWKIDKIFAFQYNSTSFYPYEQFNVTFYFASNMTHYFNVNSVTNYAANVYREEVRSNQIPIFWRGTGYTNMSEQQLYDMYKVTITINSEDVVVEGASMVYGLYGVLVVVALLLVVLFWKNILSFSNPVAIAVTTTVLFFLPILLFTFRTSIAPKYSTPIDMWSIMLILLYGALLCIQLGAKIYRTWKAKKDIYRIV
jgi:hypothetical protein